MHSSVHARHAHRRERPPDTGLSAIDSQRRCCLGDQCNEIGVAHSMEAASAVQATVSRFIASSLQV